MNDLINNGQNITAKKKKYGSFDSDRNYLTRNITLVLHAYGTISDFWCRTGDTINLATSWITTKRDVKNLVQRVRFRGHKIARYLIVLIKRTRMKQRRSGANDPANATETEIVLCVVFGCASERGSRIIRCANNALH